MLILGNSGQGKSFLLKLLVCNMLEARRVRRLSRSFAARSRYTAL